MFAQISLLCLDLLSVSFFPSTSWERKNKWDVWVCFREHGAVRFGVPSAQVGVSAPWAASFTALSTGSCSVSGGFSDCPKANVLEISDNVWKVPGTE